MYCASWLRHQAVAATHPPTRPALPRRFYPTASPALISARKKAMPVVTSCCDRRAHIIKFRVPASLVHQSADRRVLVVLIRLRAAVV